MLIDLRYRGIGFMAALRCWPSFFSDDTGEKFWLGAYEPRTYGFLNVSTDDLKSKSMIWQSVRLPFLDRKSPAQL